jgi:hypothetical protein
MNHPPREELPMPMRRPVVDSHQSIIAAAAPALCLLATCLLSSKPAEAFLYRAPEGTLKDNCLVSMAAAACSQ